MVYKHTFTAFTSTYNRAHTLQRVYDSLKAQTFRDFEWLVIDDGSTDGTEALIRHWEREADFPVRYVWQENAGKQMAINRAAQEAQGELLLVVNSDDSFIPTAFERFKFHWDSIPADQKDNFVGVSCLVQDSGGELLGTRFPYDPTDSDPLEIRFKHNVKGEKWGFVRSDVLRQYPYPKIEGERFITESLVWHRMALKYKTRYVNDVLKINYLMADSLRKKPIRALNPKGARLYYQEFINLNYPIPLQPLLEGYANYVRYSLHANVGLGKQVKDVKSPLHWLIALPAGVYGYWRDRRVMQQLEQQKKPQPVSVQTSQKG